MPYKVAVLGGFGLMAEAALHDLARSSAIAEVLAADRELARAEAVLSRVPGRRKIKPVRLDLEDTAAAARALEGCHAVINCAWYALNERAMDLALALAAHYVDLGGLYHVTLCQLRRDREFAKAGRLAVLGCGSTPGVTNLMVARLAADFDRVERVLITDASHDPAAPQGEFLPPFSIQTMLDEYLAEAPVLRRGKIVEVRPNADPEAIEFPEPIGRCTAAAVIHSEVATLPRFLKGKGVRELAFKIAYPDAVRAQLDALVSMGFHDDSPVAIDGRRISPRRFVAELARRNAARLPEKPRDFEVLRVVISGVRKGHGRTRVLDCELRPAGAVSAGAAGVGFTASAAAQLVLAGRTRRQSGVAAPEDAFDPAVFFSELGSRKAFRFVERSPS